MPPTPIAAIANFEKNVPARVIHLLQVNRKSKIENLYSEAEVSKTCTATRALGLVSSEAEVSRSKRKNLKSKID
ncbi:MULTISPECIES: hypothetical protein [Microcoleaceae]|uniref:hypothetical protein n=1 Tax=Microcoleaceae TaxID=1892252 RepID=UPI00187E426B|nr:hypothetical protein [Tychonema sp. LEGE 06208]MBE9163425.1 hypothetical protein [Tychonema sp. LEGE 06208]